MNRKKLLLAVLLLLLAVAVVSAYLRWPRQETVGTLDKAPRGKNSTEQRPAVAPEPTVDDRFVRLDLLQQEGQRFGCFRRNIFRSITRGTMPGGQPPLMALKPPPPPNVPVVPPPSLPQPPPVQRDMARFTFLGFLRKDATQTIFLSKDNKIVLVKKGDRIEGKYEAAGLTDDALTIRVLSDGTEVVIPLQENSPLMARH
jgi:hypothetical protein